MSQTLDTKTYCTVCIFPLLTFAWSMFWPQSKCSMNALVLFADAVAGLPLRHTCRSCCSSDTFFPPIPFVFPSQSTCSPIYIIFINKMKYINFVNSCVPCMRPGSNGWGRCTYCPGRSTGIVIWVDLLVLDLIFVGILHAPTIHICYAHLQDKQPVAAWLGNWGGWKYENETRSFILELSVLLPQFDVKHFEFFHGCLGSMQTVSCRVARHSFL